MNVLPIGSVIRLKDGEQKIMIISRAPLYNNEGTIGYFDYAGCLYPQGQNSQMTYFFNHEDIEEIYFTGYVDEMEKEFLKQYELQKDKIKYPKLKLKQISIILLEGEEGYGRYSNKRSY